MDDQLKMNGWFTVESFDENGVPWREEFPNGTTNVGLNDILSVYLAAGTQKTIWYGGLIDNAGFSALSANDTMSSHAGWVELTTYTEGVRQTWTPGAVSGQAVSNSVVMTFTLSGTVVIKGAFLASVNTKGGTTGILWATGSFAAAQSKVATQQITITYTCSSTGG